MSLSTPARSSPSAWGGRGPMEGFAMIQIVQPERMGMEGGLADPKTADRRPARAHGDGGSTGMF